MKEQKDDETRLRMWARASLKVPLSRSCKEDTFLFNHTNTTNKEVATATNALCLY